MTVQAVVTAGGSGNISGDSRLKSIGTTGHVDALYINNAWKDLYAIYTLYIISGTSVPIISLSHKGTPPFHNQGG